MPILAIDPGPEVSAWLLLEPGVGEQDHRVLHMAIEDNLVVRDRLRRKSLDAEVVVEMVASYGMAVGRDVFETVYWIGRFAESAGAAARLYRRDVKLHLCADSRAKDTNIRQALIDRFGPGRERAIGKKKTPGPLYGVKSHLWSALAVAVTYADGVGVTAGDAGPL